MLLSIGYRPKACLLLTVVLLFIVKIIKTRNRELRSSLCLIVYAADILSHYTHRCKKYSAKQQHGGNNNLPCAEINAA